MTDIQKSLVQSVVLNKPKDAKQIARKMLSQINNSKEAAFKRRMLAELDYQDARTFELPPNVANMLSCTMPVDFQENRYLLRDHEKALADTIIRDYQIAGKLTEMQIQHACTALFYGKSGTGKTKLANYIAYKLNIPCFYIRFSHLIKSYMGETQNRISLIFDYAKTVPCVLLLDEIDTIAIDRKKSTDLGEMTRILSTIMQEMDTLSNDSIIIATTNMHDSLDNALLRRFRVKADIHSFTAEEATVFTKQYLTAVNLPDLAETICFTTDTVTQATAYEMIVEAIIKHLENIKGPEIVE